MSITTVTDHVCHCGHALTPYQYFHDGGGDLRLRNLDMWAPVPGDPIVHASRERDILRAFDGDTTLHDVFTERGRLAEGNCEHN